MSLNIVTSAVHRRRKFNPINEDTPSRRETMSPQSNASDIETRDFEDTPFSTRRRSTHPQFSRDPPSEIASPNDRVPKSIRSATLNTLPAARILFAPKRTESNESIVINQPRRQSTLNTDYSVISNASASFEETAVWDRKAVLALDGGGIRGYSALLILEALMKKIGELEKTHPDGSAASSFHPLSPAPCIATDSQSVNSQNHIEIPETETSPWLPCHYFDYMAGTSTGGLISIMLGRLRMNIDDCIRDYEYFGDKVFGHSRWFHIRSPLFWPRDKYDHKVLEQVVQEVVDRRVPYVASFPGGRNFAFDENRCRIVVISYQRQKYGVPEKPYVFRSYKNLHRSNGEQQRLLDRNPGFAHDIPIWQAARATSAAPGYFEPQKTGDLEYLDGGMGANNPCEEIYDEVRRMNNNSNRCVRVILSVGTGRNNKTARFGGKGLLRYLHYINWAKKWASDPEKVHTNMLKLQEREQLPYFRFNVERGLGEMKLDEWRVRGALRTSVGKAIRRIRSLKKSSGHPSSCSNERTDEESAAEKAHCIPHASESSLGSKIPAWFQPKNATLDSIRKHTKSYLDREDVKRWLQECAKVLVETRRSRANQDPQKWEKACFGAWYQCKVEKCQRAEKEYHRHEDFMAHLKDKHRDIFKGPAGWKETELKDTIDKCKIIVR